MPIEPKREMLRHTLAALAYRGSKPLRGAPAGFATFKAADGVNPPGKILAHIGDLLDWALTMANGERKWHDSEPLPWDAEIARFHAALAKLDAFLASDAPLCEPAEKLFQGPIADALTHVGQICTMRRMAGAPVRGENYFVADIVAGRVGPDQAPPKREFG